MEEKHTPSYLLLQKYPESHLHNSDMLNLIQCELDLASTPFFDTTTIAYKLELPPTENKILKFLDDEYCTIPYVIYIIPNSPYGHQLPTQAKKNMLKIAING